MTDWDTQFIRCSPLFEPLREHSACGALLSAAHWPEAARIQEALDACGVVSGGGKPLRVVAQDARSGAFEDRYEVRIFREGEMHMRACNWHDFFNILVWLAFPHAKRAVNARHYQALLAQASGSTQNRGPAQDALTLFDESGIIVTASDVDLLQQVRDFSWKQIFWQQRERARSGMRCLLFGHALYEKARHPFVGMTGRGILLEVDNGFQQLPLAQQMALLDQRLARHVADAKVFSATRALVPLPLLGVPGWWPENERESFYDNTAYFRPGRYRDGAL